jgi:hypothetical protein
MRTHRPGRECDAFVRRPLLLLRAVCRIGGTRLGVKLMGMGKGDVRWRIRITLHKKEYCIAMRSNERKKNKKIASGLVI